MSEKRIEWIDLARGFAAFCMILGHSFIEHPIDISGFSWCIALHNWIYSFHMELFFFLAGCVWECSNYKPYVIKKIKRILMPYVVFGLAALFIKALGLSAVNNNESLREGLLNFVLKGGNYWFLYVLFEVFVVFPLVVLALQRIKVPNEWMIVLALIFAIVSCVFDLPEMLRVDLLCYQLPYFLVGRYLTGNKSMEIAKNKPFIGIVYGITGLLLYALITVFVSNESLMCIRYIKAFAMILVIIVMMIIVTNVEANNRIVNMFANMLKDCGKFSLQLYLFNGYLLVIIRTLLVSFMHIYNPILLVCIITTGNLLITILLCKYVLVKIPLVKLVCGL